MTEEELLEYIEMVHRDQGKISVKEVIDKVNKNKLNMGKIISRVYKRGLIGALVE